MKHLSDFPMTDAQRKIAQMGIDRTKRDHEAQEAGLGYCPECGHEYDDNAVLNSGTDKFCPKCGNDDSRILYWCNQDPTEPLHAPSDCEKFHHEP